MLHNTQIRREAEHLPIQAGRRTLLKGAGGLALAHVAFAAAPVHGVEAAPRAEAATPVPGAGVCAPSR